jgi:hypothetical protein
MWFADQLLDLSESPHYNPSHPPPSLEDFFPVALFLPCHYHASMVSPITVLAWFLYSDISVISCTRCLIIRRTRVVCSPVDLECSCVW